MEASETGLVLYMIVLLWDYLGHFNLIITNWTWNAPSINLWSIKFSISIKWKKSSSSKELIAYPHIYSTFYISLFIFAAGGKCNKQSFLIEPLFRTIFMNIPLYHHRQCRRYEVDSMTQLMESNGTAWKLYDMIALSDSNCGQNIDNKPNCSLHFVVLNHICSSPHNFH